ncbi:MAG: hypothetical protein HY901_37735, partial [Deltaproteobacteria bacterium]|nr:hypothetical protein [Deltaproteobacteria bacterium]
PPPIQLQVNVQPMPAPPAATQPLQQPGRLNEPRLGRKPPKAGWALGAGITGLVFGGIVLGLASASETTKGELVPSMPLGATALLLTIIMCPVTASGGSSARRGTDLHGVVPLRVFAWLFYGFAIASGLGLTVVGALDVTPPDGLIVATGGLAALSFLFLSIDDFVSFGQAKALANRMERGEASLEVAHYAAPVLLPDGSVGGSVGLVGRF